MAAEPATAPRLRAVAVRVVDDEEMSRLHAQHCGDPSTTDVLTFVHAALRDPDRSVDEGLVDLDIVVSLEVARREAICRGHPLERELLLYVLHGILHGIGHDDRDAEAYARMHRAEDRILEAIGVGAVFARCESTGGHVASALAAGASSSTSPRGGAAGAVGAHADRPAPPSGRTQASSEAPPLTSSSAPTPSRSPAARPAVASLPPAELSSIPR
ncbi:MAG TPA: rRNA maturation RNase YbeY [Phycisphaerales bacterium]|nr:rRNA maturation RNase YbeY [Phycisphaerales bacterium]HMP37585.1 rRNA maturation RNase YbeY [Phycisphaerales bacterium]